jgi:hypothetical protein
MKSYTLSIWFACVALEGLLLVRAWVSEWFREYPFFFAYLASVFMEDVFLLAVYLSNFRYYTPLYWYAEFFSLAIGCGVTWEIFRLVLRQYPGAGRMAHNALFFALVMVVTKALGDAWRDGVTWPSTAVELERNLRAIQAVALIVLALLGVYYVIPMGRNVKGIFTGYGLFIATSVVTLTLRASLGNAFPSAWVFLQPLCYTAVLGIWSSSLWNYEPAPAPQLQPKMEEDYQSLALVTRKGLVQARAYLAKSMRP